MPPPRGIWTTYQEDKVLKIPYPVDKGWDLYSASSWHPPKVLQQRLDDARELHQLLRDSKSQVPLVEIAGCNVKTAVGVQRNGKSFKLICESEGPNSGDGTIPLWSTRPPRGTRYLIHQNHSGLPKDRQVQRAVMSLIRGETNIDLPTDTCDQAGALLPGAWDTAGLGANELDKIAEQVAPRLRLALEGKVFALSDLPLLRFGL